VRVYFDTNVFVSAFAARGLCADLFQVVLADHQLVVGEAVLGELRRTLSRKLRMAPELVGEVEAFVRSQAEVVTEAPPIQLAVRDAADRLVVAKAVAGEAEVLVTGDSDLLSSAAEAPLPIVAPRAFWELLKAGPRRASGAS
jgi:putative PIN family toxin of toxin-antitoxin system